MASPKASTVHFEIVKILKCTLKTTTEGFLHLGIIKIPNQTLKPFPKQNNSQTISQATIAHDLTPPAFC